MLACFHVALFFFSLFTITAVITRLRPVCVYVCVSVFKKGTG